MRSTTLELDECLGLAVCNRRLLDTLTCCGCICNVMRAFYRTIYVLDKVWQYVFCLEGTVTIDAHYPRLARNRTPASGAAK